MNRFTLRRVKILDGLFYSFRLLEHHHDAMYPRCCQIRQQRREIVPALAACWGFVDVLHRLRELSQVVPGLSRKNSHLKNFLNRTKLAEKYRHYIQYLRGELSKVETNSYPVWGSLSWVDPDDSLGCHTVMIGAQLPKTEYTSTVYDRVERKWVSRVTLGIAGSSFNFDPVFEDVRIFEVFIMPWLEELEADTLNMTEELPIVTARITQQGEE